MLEKYLLDEDTHTRNFSNVSKGSAKYIAIFLTMKEQKKGLLYFTCLASRSFGCIQLVASVHLLAGTVNELADA